MSFLEQIECIRSSSVRKILIIGSQRSGTTIAGKILAHELNYEYIDEAEIAVDKLDKFFQIYFGRNNFVMQSPGLTHICHQLPSDIFFIYMIRRFNDIKRSCKRIHWDEWDKYEASKYFRKTIPSWEIKKTIWDRWQKPVLANRNMEIKYEDMNIHPMWIDKSLRENFSEKQTEI